jgi:hypothetical protein
LFYSRKVIQVIKWIAGTYNEAVPKALLPKLEMQHKEKRKRSMLIPT